MSKNGSINKFFPGNIFVGESVQSKNVETNYINGKEADEFLTEEDLPNSDTLSNFSESDGGLKWKGVPLVPPNSVMEDRAYTDAEMKKLISDLWDN